MGCIAPAPRPCTLRAATSIVIEVAAPEASEPSRKRTIPAISVGRRPLRSASLPYIGIESVLAIMYPALTQPY
jgi:hypothetical protein